MTRASSIRNLGNMIYETLMQRSQDEPFHYVTDLLAETGGMGCDRVITSYNIQSRARWSDGRRCGRT